ncbi:MAG: DUF3108 domain-containing protein [Saprospiraceae bacterium]|nr:DUF3108 domain-containing protein [Saprospiraceae bacterium]
MRMKTIRVGLVLAVLCSLMAFSNPANPTVIRESQEQVVKLCDIENTTFLPGEEITYKLYYNWNFIWLSAGEVTFRVKDLGHKYHFSASGRTYKSYEWFFKVRDYYDSYVNKESLLPEVSVRDVAEGGYKLYDRVTFDQKKNIARSTRGKTRSETKTTEHVVDDCMHDILSIIYFTRNIEFNNLQENAQIPIKIFMDNEVWPLRVRYKGKEEKKKVKDNGTFKTIKFAPEVIAGQVFNENAEMNVWVTDDQNKIPLLIESPVAVGSVKAVLKDYKGLRYDMTAKVK